MCDSLIAVADGVGGWNDHGVDPGLFSRELCANVWEEYNNSKSINFNLKDILVNAVKKTKNKGSSTFVMAGLDPDT